MKKLVIIISILCCSLMFAEEKKASTFEAGIKGGMTMSTFWGKDTSDTKWTFGGIGGLDAAYYFLPYLGVQLEALFAMKGGKEEVASISAVTTLDYIEIPLLIKGRYATKYVTPFVYVGPYVGFNILADTKINSESTDVKDNIEPVDFGLAMGLGANFNLPVGSITLDIRYDLGLLKVEKSSAGVESEAKNMNLAVMVGYSYPFF